MLQTLFPASSETFSWVRLALIPNISGKFWLNVVSKFGVTPTAIVKRDVSHLPPAVQAQLSHYLSIDVSEQERALVSWLSKDSAHQLVSFSDIDYPSSWRELSNPPLVVFAHGARTRLNDNIFAIVGSRNATPSGLKHAADFARVLGEAGLTIVSGLALGIDGAAHSAALSASAGTIAIMGSGIDVVYPKQHRALHQRIVAEGGLVLSEFLPGTPPLKHHFPQRNRLIGTLAIGTLVVEAAVKSGSLITAQFAVDNGRDVFAVPGNISDLRTAGCHRLIQQGAKLVMTAEDVLDEYSSISPKTYTPIFPYKEKKWQECLALDPILDSVDFEPTSVDTLVLRTGRAAPEIVARLLELELDGFVAPFCGGYIKLRG